MTMVNNEMVHFARKELVSIVMQLTNTTEKNKAIQISNEIIKIIDWDNSALMHKGLSWMAKNYLHQQSSNESM